MKLGDLHASLDDPLLDGMNFLNEVVERFPQAISFAPGRPLDFDGGGAAVARYLERYQRYLREDRGYGEAEVGRALSQYGRTGGQINDLIARTLRNDEGIEVAPESILVTVGCQEGMLLVLRALVRDRADTILLTSPCYVGVSGAARFLGASVRSVPEGENGVDLAALRRVLAEVRESGGRARALYLVADFSNPSGSRLSLSERRELLGLARSEDLLLIEDNPYSFFSDAEPLPTLKSLDETGQVIYLGSFSKTCFPGARVGYVVADQRVEGTEGAQATLLAELLGKLKSMTSVNTAAVSQGVIGGMLLESGLRLREWNRPVIGAYVSRMQCLLGELERAFPEEERSCVGVQWRKPQGGFFVVLRVPFRADVAALECCGREYGVLWTPMGMFYPEGGGAGELRLSCSSAGLDQFPEGVRRLREFVFERWRSEATERGESVSRGGTARKGRERNRSSAWGEAPEARRAEEWR